MKLFFRYLAQRRRWFYACAAFCVIFTASFALYQLPVVAVLYPTLLCAALGTILVICDYARVKRRHKALKMIRGITDVTAGTLPPPDGIEDADHREIIRLMGEEHGRYRADIARKYAEMSEYYTIWAHQIKTPIASMRLHLQNEDSALARKLNMELRRVEQYVEMVMTYVRLNSESTDYVIREYALDDIVRQAVKGFAGEFIVRKLKLVYEPLNARVVTDEKWLSFVIEQIISNALKYTSSGSITIFLEPEKRLCIRDTGIGIAPEDMPRIFEKGYTGYNGRADMRASGIGLYLCRRVCDRLGHAISVSSAVDCGTTVAIDLAQRKLEVE